MPFIIVLILLAIFVCIYNYSNRTNCETTLKVMTKEDYWKLSPYNPIDKISFEKSLFSKEKKYREKYFEMQALYRKGLDIFLDEELQLTAIDKELSLDKLGITECKDKDLYRKYSTLNTTYVYLRNYVHIERLSDKQIEFLYGRITECNEEIDQELYNLVKNTFEDVLIYDFSEKKIELFRDCVNAIPPYANVNSNSLIIMISYDIKNDDDYEKYRKNKDLLENYSNKFVWKKAMKIEVIIAYRGEIS